MLSRRCGSSGSSAAASMSGRGLEIHHAFRPAAPRPPPPPLRPAAVHNLESWRRFSTAGRESADKTNGFLRMWWQRARNRVKNADPEERAKALFVYSSVSLGATMCYVMKSFWDLSH
ncbi:unnamed protein product [Urochloa humidicola]